jgi:hypothetical protein
MRLHEIGIRSLVAARELVEALAEPVAPGASMRSIVTKLFVVGLSMNKRKGGARRQRTQFGCTTPQVFLATYWPADARHFNSQQMVSVREFKRALAEPAAPGDFVRML